MTVVTWRRGRLRSFLTVALLAIVAMSAVRAASAQQTLAVVNNHFTVNGAPQFLLFVSYFDAMRRSNAGGQNTGDIDTDLQYFKDHGYDGIRILPNWWHYECAVNVNDRADDGLFTTTTIRESRWPVF